MDKRLRPRFPDFMLCVCRQRRKFIKAIQTFGWFRQVFECKASNQFESRKARLRGESPPILGDLLELGNNRRSVDQKDRRPRLIAQILFALEKRQGIFPKTSREIVSVSLLVDDLLIETVPAFCPAFVREAEAKREVDVAMVPMSK